MRSMMMALVVLLLLVVKPASAQSLDKQKLLEAQTFWDNRDWDWYKEHIPFFECPDPDITTTYYYRWELLTKHLTYGSPNSGYSFTEFIDRPFWSGAYGAISCPAGHQLYEARWLRKPTIARDYLKYWFRTPGAQPRNYSTWLADSAVAVQSVHPDDALLVDLLPDLIANYEGWEKRHFVPEVGLFWQTGHDDGMEFNINSRQTKDILRGAPSYRPSFNAYMWADAIAIAKVARLAGKEDIAKRFDEKASSIKAKMLALLWDEKRQFFFPVFKNDEERDGHKIKALTRTYESGQFAGDSHGRELIGYVPWQFNMIDRDKGYEAAWSKLMQRDGFYSDFGPSTVERNDPMFLLKNSCCWWSGQSWPYATTQTLKAMGNLLQREQLNDGSKVASSRTRESSEVPHATLVGSLTTSATSDAAVKAAVAKSLPFLEKDGVAWMNDRGCMSCHHIPFLVWSHRAAQKHGLAVDDKKLGEWEQWCQKDSLAHRNLYRLQTYELGRGDATKLPQEVKNKLKPLIEKPFKTEAEFLAQLKPLLTEEELKAHQAVITKTAERVLNQPDRSGGGLDVVAQLLLAGHGSESALSKPEFRDGTVDLMNQLQRPNGSWMPGNQFLSMRRWSESVADQISTMWAALALAAYEPDAAKRSAVVEKAIAFQRQQLVPPSNNEWLATRLLFEKQFGSMDEVTKLTQQLLAAQKPDGGWSWENDRPSDAYTTGIAIYALAKVGGDHAEVFANARGFLLSQQAADGSWPTRAMNFSKQQDPEKLKARDEIYHYWATAWAAIGLLETLDKAHANEAQAAANKPVVTQADYLKLLQIYAKSHRKNGKPYLAEALHPDTGSFEGHDGYNHSEHYFHSGFCDLVISGLVGLTTREDETLEVHPLAPADWDYFALDDVPYREHRISIFWDKTGERYKHGAGLRVLVDGKEVAKSEKLARLVVKQGVSLPSRKGVRDPRVADINYAVNNDGDYYPRIAVSHTGPRSSPSKLIDGNDWYHRDPPNRWTTEGSKTDTDWLELDLGMPRRVHTAKLFFLDDEKVIVAPTEFTLEVWRDQKWQPLPNQQRTPAQPIGHRPNVVKFAPQDISKLRVVFTHGANGRTGLTELELWGDAERPIVPAPAPKGNLAYRSPAKQDGFPKVSASHTSRYDKVEMVNDGRIVYGPTPHNRWTSYESKSPTDWLEVDFGEPQEIGRVDLHFYDDRGGVQSPTSYVIEHWTGSEWKKVSNAKSSPETPTGGVNNTVRFDRVTASKVRAVFTHKGNSRSGLTEIEVWKE